MSAHVIALDDVAVLMHRELGLMQFYVVMFGIVLILFLCKISMRKWTINVYHNVHGRSLRLFQFSFSIIKSPQVANALEMYATHREQGRKNGNCLLIFKILQNFYSLPLLFLFHTTAFTGMDHKNYF